jgi:hypothetical protein
MVTAYWIVASITFLIILNAFLKDGATQKASVQAFVFISMATLLWPITLPFIVSSKLRRARAYQQVSAADKATGRWADAALEKKSKVILSTLRN